jgi:site-specific recombinase XerD
VYSIEVINLARLTREKTKHRDRLNSYLLKMPNYIEEFVNKKKNHSPSTLLVYMHDFDHFFSWCINEGLVKDCEKIKDIPLSFLETLAAAEVEIYVTYLSNEYPISEDDKGLSARTINRKISALKSLFKYLTTQTEDKNGECYFYRNVMAKIDLIKDKQDISNIRNEISKKILHNEEDMEFLSFIDIEYGDSIKSTHSYHFYQRDKERDLAIIALFLSSGIRVSELANIKEEDIEYDKRYLSIIRKGDKKSTIVFQAFALPYLLSYKDVRSLRYKGVDKQSYLFVTMYQGRCQPMSVRAIQNMVAKYSTAFKEDKNKKLSPHKLRHTFATKRVKEGIPIDMLQTQLGHEMMNTTSKYTNSKLEDLKEAMDKTTRK